MNRTFELRKPGYSFTTDILHNGFISYSSQWFYFFLYFPTVLTKSSCLLCQETPRKIMAVILFSGPEYTLCEQGAGEQITVSVVLRPFTQDFRNLEGCS